MEKSVIVTSTESNSTNKEEKAFQKIFKWRRFSNPKEKKRIVAHHWDEVRNSQSNLCQERAIKLNCKKFKSFKYNGDIC
jgi:hypothetical protein